MPLKLMSCWVRRGYAGEECDDGRECDDVVGEGVEHVQDLVDFEVHFVSRVHKLYQLAELGLVHYAVLVAVDLPELLDELLQEVLVALQLEVQDYLG